MLQFKQKWMVLTVTGLVKLKALWQKRFIDGNQEQNKDRCFYLKMLKENSANSNIKVSNLLGSGVILDYDSCFYFEASLRSLGRSFNYVSSPSNPLWI